jgi:hypothetical protein
MNQLVEIEQDYCKMEHSNSVQITKNHLQIAKDVIHVTVPWDNNAI